MAIGYQQHICLVSFRTLDVQKKEGSFWTMLDLSLVPWSTDSNAMHHVWMVRDGELIWRAGDPWEGAFLLVLQ